MTLIGSVIHETAKLRKVFRNNNKEYAYFTQQKELRKLLERAKNTAFGKAYHFNKVIKSDNIVETFQRTIPYFDYNAIYNEWWIHTLKGAENVCWPGKVKYFALTSGTSESASKRIPITNDMLKSIVRTGMNQFLTLSDYTLPRSFYDKGVLMVGGSTDLTKINQYYEGDLSGILTGRLPAWFNNFYKPGKKIAMEKDWNTKLDKITQEAKNWDIGIICGVPAWVQILLERIIKYYHLKNIHEIWPNFKFFAHGGVCFDPYKKGFAKYLGHEINYQDTYLASEGFFAYQAGPDKRGMQLVLNNGIFFEFVPFNQKNFSHDGNLLLEYESLLLDDVKEEVDYAVLISTNAGAWRYLVGDTIKFTSIDNYEILITGRTKHFLSLCGEHMSVDNMNKAIQTVDNEFDLNSKEYTVVGIPYNNFFAHKWFIGTDKKADKHAVCKRLDEVLKEINDDYRTERKAALQEVIVELISNELFYAWMKMHGKEGGQNKFPRVLKMDQLESWEKFIRDNNISND